MDLLLIAIGMFIDVLPAIVVAAPVLAPAMIQLGFDGNITPPVGMTLMTASRIAGVSYESAIKQSLPFLLSHLVVLAIASASPALVLWFPRLVGAIR